MALVVALLLAAIGVIGAMNQFSLVNIRDNQIAAESRLWQKLDRVTNLMQTEKQDLQVQIRDVQKLVLCHDRDIAEIKERIKNHVEQGQNNGTYGGKK